MNGPLKLGTRLADGLLLGAIVYAPWAFGSTRAWTVEVLNALLGCALVLWLPSAVAQRAWRAIPPVLLATFAFLAVYGWAMALNAKFSFDPASRAFTERAPVATALPGSIDYGRSSEIALRVTLLLGVICLVCHRAADSAWRKRLVHTLALTGAALVAFGLAQRVLDAPSIFWQARDTGDTFFATYRYHSNAGSFVNLVWPLSAALLAARLHRLTRLRECLLWAVALVLCGVGLAVTGARAASGVAVLGIVAWAAWWIRQTRRDQLPAVSPPSACVAGALGVLLFASVAATTGLDIMSQRWNKVEELLTIQNPRLIVDQVCLTKMMPESGWTGFGPGTWRHAFPYFTAHLGDQISGIWLDAHQDYLQTIIEWGYIGALAWAVCIFGGIVRSFKTAHPSSFRDRALHFALLTATGGTLLHSLVDFPLQIASLQLYFAVLLGLLWGRPEWAASRSSTAGRRRTHSPTSP